MYFIYLLLVVEAVAATLLDQDVWGASSDWVSPRDDERVKRHASSHFRRRETEHFLVNGSEIPEVDFDIGESYAGLLPIDGKNDTNELFFWFFPSSQTEKPKEIVIWLSGGPGCASTAEMIFENGPFTWKPGTYRPIRNAWSWHHLTNVVWVDQPIGTGFSQGTVTAENAADVARQFAGFWENFVNTFSLQGYKVYIAGSSYSGQWTPYVASEMLGAEDEEYFNVAGILVYNGLYGLGNLHIDVPALSYINTWKSIFGLNDSKIEQLTAISDQCGMSEYYEKYLTFPPTGVQPVDVPGFVTEDNESRPECDMQFPLISAWGEINPCWSTYNLLAHCPRAWDVLGFGEGRGETWSPGPIYFRRADVQKAINAPRKEDWQFCNRNVFVNGVDTLSNPGPGSMPVLPGIIDKTRNVILGVGALDNLLFGDGTLLAIQNLTFGGELGFQSPPEQRLFVPARQDTFELQGPTGNLGTWHHERGLTYFETRAAGHFIGKDAPSVALRALEILLGRVGNFSSDDPFTIS